MKEYLIPAGMKPKRSRGAILRAQQSKRLNALIPWLQARKPDGAIILPLPCNLANARMHWRLKDTLRVGYMAQCDGLRAARLIPPPPKEPPAMWRVAVAFYGAADTDEDNGRAMMKFALDWLVRNGYARDDNKRHLKVVSFENEVDRRVPRLEFRTVEDL